VEGVQGTPRGGEGGRHGIESRSGSQSRAAEGEVRGGIERAAALDQEETCVTNFPLFFFWVALRFGTALLPRCLREGKTGRRLRGPGCNMRV
jgi:hypothetical protein